MEFQVYTELVMAGEIVEKREDELYGQYEYYYCYEEDPEEEAAVEDPVVDVDPDVDPAAELWCLLGRRLKSLRRSP